ncbi:redoxin family protein [uncultured Mucilaginibacter sp.]|uniref:TlpA family protein disulfide reductase n=1 Tax=uncultured Mucilaginibacter sp. TaxID=797541 RepID=UPI0025EED673|nr:redoxin family protein [uncultured Mucilaginibacter sp.]
MKPFSPHHKIIKSFSLFIALCLLGVNVKSQPKELVANDSLPDIKIHSIVNYKNSTAKISDFKGKLLIFDFWGTFCAPCVAMFPKADSLEKIFEGKLKFLPITTEPKNKVVAFLNKMEKIRHVRPISVVEDTVFTKMFQVSTLPHYVWVNELGKVIGTTGPEEINEININALLSGKPASFEKRITSPRKKIGWEKSLYVLNHNFLPGDENTKQEPINRNDLISYSIAGKYIPNVEGRFYFDTAHFGAMNASVNMLYRIFYSLSFYDRPLQGAFDSKRNHLFEVRDQKLLNQITIPSEIKAGTQAMTEWIKKNSVSYEIVYPPGLNWKQKMALVKQDLDRYFAKPMGFKAYVEKREDNEVAKLLKINDRFELKTDGEEPLERHDRFSYMQKNMPLSHFISMLNGYFLQDKNVYALDQSGFEKNVDLELTCDMTNFESINTALQKYGLRFVKERAPIDVLVFKETSKL